MELCSWDSELPLSASLDFLVPLALSHARESGPYAADLVKLLSELDWAGICRYELDYNIGASAASVLAARQALGFFTKLEALEIGVDKEAVAYSKFVESEAACSQVNEVFRARRHGRYSFLPRLEAILSEARRKIRRALGPCPKLADLKLAFGPGATVSIKRTDSNPTAKMAAGFECSTDVYASGLLPELLREVPHWSHALKESVWGIDEEGWLVETVDVRLCAGNLAFVPKNAKTYRSIVVEPCLNGFVQAGLGKYIARRLRSVGVDIRDQVPNQEWALLGSLLGDLATIDLSSASDMIARELVRALLPEDWYRLLSAFRTSEVLYKGKTIALEKFSSMGNGFTFPLETLIFWALTRSAVGNEGIVSVYGDDIICPVSRYDEVSEVLTAVGFVVNKAKSYAAGPFRESCGCDYYNGINVRPFYQKDLVSGRSLFVLHNWYARRFDLERASLVRRAIPRELRIYGPDGYGDGHLVSDEYPRRRTAKDRKRGYSGHSFETYTPITRKYKSPYAGDYVSPLYSVYVREALDLVEWDELPYQFEASDDAPPREAPQGYTQSGPRARPTWPLPGVEGYRRSLIYILG